MPGDEYHKLPSISQSALKVFLKNRLDYKAQFIDRTGISISTAAMSLGTLVHSMLLESSTLGKNYFQYLEEGRPEPNKTMASVLNKEWKASLERHCQQNNLGLVPSTLWQQGDSMVAELCSHPELTDLFFPDIDIWEDQTELYIPWKIPDIDLDLRSKLDKLLVNPKEGKAIVVDYKTTSANNSVDFGWSVKKYGYDIQAAFYQDAAAHYLESQYVGVTFDTQVLFVPQRTTAPYPVLGILELDPQTLSSARDTYRQGLLDLEVCLKTNNWVEPLEVQVLQLSKPLTPLFNNDELILP